jgi:hypothetical protein
MIIKMVSQIKENGMEMFIYHDDDSVNYVLLELDDMKGAIEWEDGNSPNDIKIKNSEVLNAVSVVQCINCNKLLLRSDAKKIDDEDFCCQNGCE